MAAFEEPIVARTRAGARPAQTSPAAATVAPPVAPEADAPSAVPASVPPAPQSLLSRRLTTAVQRRAVLQRLRKEDETKYLQLCGLIDILEEYYAVLLKTEANWNEYHVGITLRTRLQNEVQPLIAEIKQLRDGVHAEIEPEAKLQSANKKSGQALKQLDAISTEGQDADQQAVADSYAKIKEKHIASVKKEFAKRQAAAAADALLKKAEAEAAATAKTISDTGVTPNDAGPAFNFPSCAGSEKRRDDLHTWITLSWKQFRYLPREALNNPKCFVYQLSKVQLETLMTRIGDETVTEYAFQGWPSTRAPVVGGVDGLVWPVKLGSMTPKLGAEIVIDWIVFNPGHTAPAKNLVQSFNFTADETKFTDFGNTVTRTANRIRYQYGSGKLLIANAARDAIITYYDG